MNERRFNSHYAEMTKQPVEVNQEILTPEEFRGWLKGTYVKYKMRAGHKAGEPFDKDMTKGMDYLKWLYLDLYDVYIIPKIEQTIDDEFLLKQLQNELDEMIQASIEGRFKRDE